jgi:hypothetical protein
MIPERRPELGAITLDRLIPGWYWQVNIVTLEMRCGDRCILGQLYGSFLRGAYQIHLRWPREKALLTLGFSLPYDVPDGEWDLLRAAWVALILARRNGHG